MNRRLVHGIIAALLIQSLACGSSGLIPITGDTEGAPSAAGGNPGNPSAVGTVENIRTQVYAGQPEDLKLITGETELGNDDFVKVEDGGKARLSFPGPISLLLYNQSELDDIRLEFEENSNPRIVNRLIRGGLSGYVEPGSQQEIDLPFGAQVNVLGTSFFVLFDDATEVITVGKFDGTLSIRIPGRDEIFLDDLELVDVTADGRLTRVSPLPFTAAQFDSAADSCASPIQGVNILRRDSMLPQPGGSGIDEDLDLPCEPLTTSTTIPGMCETPVAYVRARTVQLREGPDLRFLSVGDYKQGDQFTILGRYQGWYQVEFPDGNKGWLYTDWITFPPDFDLEAVCKISYRDLPPTPRVDVDSPPCIPAGTSSCP